MDLCEIMKKNKKKRNTNDTKASFSVWLLNPWRKCHLMATFCFFFSALECLGWIFLHRVFFAIKVFSPIMNMQRQTGTSSTCWRTLLLCQKKNKKKKTSCLLTKAFYSCWWKSSHMLSVETQGMTVGCLKRYSKKKKRRRREEKRQSTAAVNTGRVIFFFFLFIFAWKKISLARRWRVHNEN